MKKEKKVNDESLGKKEILKFTNGMLHQFSNSKAFIKLIDSQLDSSEKFNLYQLSMKVLNSPEIQAYTKLKDEIINKFIENEIERIKKEDPEKEIKPSDIGMPVDHPEMINLLTLETTLEIKKPAIKVTKLDKSISVSDMIQLSWLVDFIE